MKIFKTKLKNVLKIKLEPFKDHRGKYLEIFNKELLKKQKEILTLSKMISRSQKKMFKRYSWRLQNLETCNLFRR